MLREIEPTGLRKEANAAVTLPYLLFAVVILTALLVNHHSAITAIVISGLFYGVTSMAALFVSSGGLTAWLITREMQITQRLSYAPAGVRVVDPLPIAYKDAAPPLPGPQTTYVAPEPPAVARDAILWALSLYDATGEPDPDKVDLTAGKPVGRLRREGPPPAIKEYLLARGVLKRDNHALWIRLARFPTADRLRELL